MLPPIVFALALIVIRCEAKEISVEITYEASVEGYEYSAKILAYTGIPYAQAPIGALRFGPPQRVQFTGKSTPINSILKENVTCMQLGIRNEITGDEDCLYLNVYTPHKQITHGGKLPVMVFIHGGGFAWGAGTHFKPDYLLRDGAVLLVTINYRLGALGFLAAGGPHVVANNGLKDQSMALQWIHEHVALFGGDPQRITVFGNSAGAASSHLHLFAARGRSKGLFQSLILQSGGAFCRWAVRDFQEIVDLSVELARLAGCPVAFAEGMLTCLRALPVEQLLRNAIRLKVFEIDPFLLFAPTVEPPHRDAFLLAYPETLIEAGDFYDVPIMQGTTSDEGAIRTAIFIANPKSLRQFDEHFEELYDVIAVHPTPHNAQVVARIRQIYFGNGGLDQDGFKPMTSLWTDEFFGCTDRTVTLHRHFSKQPIFSYQFAHEGALTFAKVFANSENIDALGVCHMDELLYLFPLEFFFEHFTSSAKALSKQDVRVSLFMTKLWTHFATYRTFDNFSHTAFNWQPVQTTTNEYLKIGQDLQLEMGNNLFARSNDFWSGVHAKDEL